MKIAQIRHGKVTVLYGTDPRTTGFAASLPPDVSLVDASDIDGIDIGWSSAPIDGERWAFAATQDALDKALACAVPDRGPQPFTGYVAGQSCAKISPSTDNVDSNINAQGDAHVQN
jgi:hypothetical protein